MRILLIGTAAPSHLGGIFHRALLSLGHDCVLVDESLASGWLDRGAAGFIGSKLNSGLPSLTAEFNQLILDAARRHSPQVVLSVKGSLIEPDTLRRLCEETSAVLANYSTDDPFNPAASNPYIVESLPLWDLYATPRPHTIDQLSRVCRGDVFYLPFGYDPDAHFPDPPVTPDDRHQFCSDVAFAGVCDRDRVGLLRALASSKDIDVKLYGGGRRYQLWPELRRRHHGFAIGQDYRRVLGGAKIALSIQRLANRDTHVMRTFEIPACGAFLLAERTDEQLTMFQEDKEAVYFEGIDELRDKLHYYLRNDDRRVGIARAGYRRVTSGRNTYRDRLETLLQRVPAPRRSLERV